MLTSAGKSRFTAANPSKAESNPDYRRKFLNPRVCFESVIRSVAMLAVHSASLHFGGACAPEDETPGRNSSYTALIGELA